MKKRIQNQNAFTLIELVVVMVLIGIVSIAMLPNIGNFFESASMSTALRSIQSDLRYAQTLATTTGDSYGFRAVSATTCEVYEVDTGNVVTSPYDQEPMQTDLTKLFHTLSFEQASYASYNVTFDAQGNPSSALEIVLTDTSGTEANQSVEISDNGLIMINNPTT